MEEEGSKHSFPLFSFSFSPTLVVPLIPILFPSMLHHRISFHMVVLVSVYFCTLRACSSMLLYLIKR